MLIAFRVANYRSFLDEQTLGYASSWDQSHAACQAVTTGCKAVPSILKSALVFGPNGSGKSNLISALQTLQGLALHSTDLSPAQFAAQYTPFHFGPPNERATELGVEVMLGTARYRYDIHYDAHRIVYERLLVYKTGKPQKWFERSIAASEPGESWTPFSPGFHGPRELWRKATRPTSLFLTTAARLNCRQLAPLVRWFEHCLTVVSAVAPEDLSGFAAKLGNPTFKGQALRFLRSLDVRVDDVRAINAESARKPIDRTHPARTHSRAVVSCDLGIEVRYSGEPGCGSAWLEASQDCAGLRALLALYIPLTAAAEHEGIIVIDDFGTHLHPLVTRALMQLAMDDATGRKSQTLFTSHSTELMSLDLLRRDEIWLVELDSRRASVLSTLLKRGTRKQETVGRKYLRGGYGGIPDIGRPDSKIGAGTSLIKPARAKPAC